LAEQVGAEVIDAVARVGGGALPLLELTGPAVALEKRHDPILLARRLRLGDPSLLVRISDNRVLIDPRCLRDDEIQLAAQAVTTTVGQEARDRAGAQDQPPRKQAP